MSNFVSPLLHLTRINGNSTDFGDTQLKRATETNCFNERPEWFVTCHTITNKKTNQYKISLNVEAIELNVMFGVEPCPMLNQIIDYSFKTSIESIYFRERKRERKKKRTRIKFAFTFAFAFNLNVFSLISHEFVTRVSNVCERERLPMKQY